MTTFTLSLNLQDCFSHDRTAAETGDVPWDQTVAPGDIALGETDPAARAGIMGAMAAIAAPDTTPTLGVGTLTPAQWEAYFQDWLGFLRPSLPLPWQQVEEYELSLRFTDDREIQAFNHQYRQQDQATDVLAFAALEADYPVLSFGESPEPLYLGDIVIAVPTAQAQAQQQGHDLTTELMWLASHGFLHLLGWDHPDEAQLQAMLQQQQQLLTQVGYSPAQPSFCP
ncbi:rRNA maturation RNase YbeY [Prochlorothrix hollandica]|nr:rRNA maturation RNase YbeY [Prochlorothrix hollandica]